MMECETCAFFAYDEYDDEYRCTVSMDEDDYVRFTERRHRRCPYWRDGDEYSVVRSQN